jgi:putative oxidoreductase
MNGWLRVLAGQSALGLAVLRAALGLVLGVNGYLTIAKSGWDIATFIQLGIPLPHLTAPLVTALGLVGGFLVFIGLFTRVLALVFGVEFAVATTLVVLDGGLREAALPLLMLAGFLALLTNGPGAIAIDRPGQRWEP